MKIIKPQKSYKGQVEYNMLDIKDEECLENCNFINEEIDNKNLYLNNVDLSTSKIEKMSISIEDIKGAIIEQFQTIDLVYLLGVKIK